jgi:hypothetical protein
MSALSVERLASARDGEPTILRSSSAKWRGREKCTLLLDRKDGEAMMLLLATCECSLSLYLSAG